MTDLLTGDEDFLADKINVRRIFSAEKFSIES